ncbi:GNAT family N-acetyltransferase [Paenibacillus glycinis]|uniref:GNAT family N-acetyltransferase n=1 Tax=Paenibacillus glycinis TaxID=2697035 RepID=A0ABW9XKW0_9BACL|nr:GNAT family N-acetyltransferase [Paenibacillus glycinis]NBD23269.1 GNAT family N-acetyltransferase [Paenibacillus glycinis]
MQALAITIRRAQAEEAEALRALYVEAAGWIRAAKGINQWREEWFTPSYMEQFIREREVFAAIRDGEPVGCFSVEWEYEALWGELFHGDAGYVHRLVVSRLHPGQGIGESMLAWAADYIRRQGKSWLRLDCMADNPALNAYYLRNGLRYRGQFDGDGYSASRYELAL